ncbi:DUF177 domain-containing protein [Polaribacter sp.]|nr:DUF177 domain-containing protein [Polaribacter sp.]
MKDLKQFNIQFVGLKLGKHSFEYQIDNTFFGLFDYDEFSEASIKIDLEFVKKTTFFELVFHANGFVTVPCDVTNELYDQEIENTLPLLVKFGLEFNNEDEEILTLPHGDYELNVAQFIYEMIVLSVPLKRVHPKVEDGTMESEALKKLKELEIKENKTVANTDPRWDKLKNLITEKKT